MTGFKEEAKAIFKLSWPVMVGMILQSLLASVDLMFISRLGTTEAAAASLGTSTYGVIFVMTTLTSAGAIAIVARHYGEGRFDKIKHYVAETGMLAVLFGTVIGLVAWYFSEDILRIMYNPSAEVLALANSYLKIIFLGVVVVFLSSTFRSVLNGLGDTVSPLVVFGIANVINIVLDPLLIFGAGMGIRGAALATFFANFVAMLLITYRIFDKVFNRDLAEVKNHFSLQSEHVKAILRIGGWATINQVARPITGMLMFRIVYQVGQDAATAAFGIGGQMFNYTFIFLTGIIMALSIMTGQALGRGDEDTINSLVKNGLILAGINMLVFGIPYMLVPDLVMKIFLDDPIVIAIGVRYLRIVYLGLVFVIFTMVFGGVFQGAGDTYPPMISSLIANVLFKLPAAYILAIPLGMGTDGVWFAISLSVIVEAIIIGTYYKTERWKRVAIV